MFSARLCLSLILLVTIGSAMLPSAYAQEDGLRIVATFSILADVAQQVAGDQAQVTSLMPVGADPHTFIASPQDVASLIEADLVLTNGVNFEEGLLDILNANASDITQVVASSCVPIWEFDHDHDEDDEHDHDDADDDHDDDDHPIDPNLAALCDAHWGELATITGGLPAYFDHTEGPLYAVECDLHEHDEEHDDNEDDHHAGCDPHVWMDAHNIILWTLLIRDTLSTLDPANAEAYRTNAEAYIQQVNAVIAPNAALLAAIPPDQRVLITSHNTFGYLANPADFKVIEGIIPGGGTAGEPSASEFVDLIQLVAETGVPAIFTENTTPPALIDSLAEETGVEVKLLYTDSLGPADSPAATYLGLFTYNVQTIAEALGD